MTKRRTILAIVLGILMALCLSFAVACGGDDEGGNSSENGTIRWTINDPANVTVTVDGKTDLPTSYAVGETLTFKAEPKNGYEAEVKNGRTTLRANNKSEYSFQVKKGNNDVSVTVSKKISGIQVTANKDLVYYAGETVNNSDLTVKLLYATGESETKTDGFVINYTPGNASFALGDTSFTVTYGTVTSAPVQLKSAVVGKVTIDPQGGKIADSYKTALEANTEIANVAVDATTNVLTFTFAQAIVKAIDLPRASEISRGEGEAAGDYAFQSWDGGAAVPAELDVSTTYTAKWTVTLVSVSKVEFIEKNDKAVLHIEGTVGAADNTTILFFEEGQAHVEYNGGVLGKNLKRGDSIDINFEVEKLATATTESGDNFLGKWMDIKFVSENGNVRDVQEINISTVEVDMDQTVQVGDYIYSFAEYAGALKVIPKIYFENRFTVSAVDGEPLKVKIEGQVSEKYAGKAVYIDHTGGERYTVAVGQDGKYSVTFDFSDDALGNNLYFHFSLVESVSDSTVIYKDGSDGNLLNDWCTAGLDLDLKDNGKAPDGSNGNLLTSQAMMLNSDDYSKVFYIGFGKWGGFIAYGYNEKQSVEQNGDVQLKVDNMETPTKVYYIVNVKVSGRTGYTQQELEKMVFGNTDGGVVVYHSDATKNVYTKGEDDKITEAKLYYDVTAHAGKSMLWCNMYMETAGEGEGATPTYTKLFELSDGDMSTKGLQAVVNGQKYYIYITSADSIGTSENPGDDYGMTNTYSRPNLSVEAAGEEDVSSPEVDPDYVPPVYSLAIDYEGSAESLLTIVNGSPVLTIKGTVEGYDPDHVKFDVQVDEKWNYIVPATQSFVVDESGRFTLTVTLSDIPVNAAKYLMHIQVNVKEITETGVTYLDKNGKAYDLELMSELLAAIEKADGDVLATQKVGSKVYSVVVYSKWNRHMVALTVADDTTPVYTATEVEIVKEADKVYYVVKGTSRNYTDEVLRTEHIRVTLQHNDNWNKQGWEYVTPEEQTLTVTNGAWTLKADVTSVANGSYTSKLTSAAPGEAVGENNSSDLKQVQTTETALELSGKKYVTVHAVGSSVPKQYWGCVGFEVFASTESKIETLRADLEVDNDKLYYVVTLRAPGSTSETLKTLKLGKDKNENDADRFQCSKVVASENGIYFTLYYDITTLESSEWYWTHLYNDGTAFDGSDGNVYADFVTGQVTFNGKKYELLHGDGNNGTPNTWWVVVINITTAEN